MGRGVNIPWIGGSKYHGKGGQNTIGRGVDVPWVGGSIFHGYRVDIPSVGGQNFPKNNFKVQKFQKI